MLGELKPKGPKRRLRKGEVFAYVGLSQNLKDLNISIGFCFLRAIRNRERPPEIQQAESTAPKPVLRLHRPLHLRTSSGGILRNQAERGKIDRS